MKRARAEDREADYDDAFDFQKKDEDEARLIEERRKRRMAIVQKYKTEDASTSTLERSKSTELEPKVDEDVTPPPMQVLNNGNIELAKGENDAGLLGPENQGMSAAEYNPDLDRAPNKEHLLEQQQAAALDKSDGESEYEEVEVDDEDDVDDIFALGDSDAPKKKIIRVKKNRPMLQEPKPGNETTVKDSDVPATLTDNWDDAEGYYRISLGEKIGEGGRYHVFANLGRGMFSAVVRARDTQQNDKEVAIKVIRSQESMYKAGLKEISILQKLANRDPDDRRHLVRLLGHFEHRNHLCMVFESLNMNLREVVRRFGKDVGLNLRAVRTYAHQMFLALALMRKAEIMHADLKPDNILVNESKTAIKVCDLGSASSISEMEITPYLVSRFYRAPEIILGLPYDCALDMWSIGCTLFELFTGRILFPGKSNNHMLLLMQELKGKFTTKQIRKGRFSGMHFDDQNAFISRERDRATGNDVLKKVATFNPIQAGTDLRSRLLPPQATKGMSQHDLRLTNSFIDLLSRTLELDPARRITPVQALQHPLFSG